MKTKRYEEVVSITNAGNRELNQATFLSNGWKHCARQDIGLSRIFELIVSTGEKILDMHVATYDMLSGSVAQAPTALVTLTRRAWFVLVSRFTSEGMPPAFRIVVLLAGICAHSPKDPTTLINTCKRRGTIL